MPFANESDSLEIGGLSSENRVDQVSIYGSIDNNRDNKGVEVAQKISAVVDTVVKKLSSEKLPDSIRLPKETETVKNTFAW